MDTGSPAATDGFIAGRYLGQNPRSEEHIRTVQKWIDCCSTHVICKITDNVVEGQDSSQTLLPTRCIEIDETGLYLRECEGQRGSYAVLSHRWTKGMERSTESCKTTVSNFEDREKGNGFQNLPKGFEDAIELTRRLKIRYLWIDSICIIQHGDGDKDWIQESSKMTQYYRQSTITIAVADSASGFLSLRPNAPFKSIVRLPYRDKHGTQRGYLYVYKRMVSFVSEYMKEVDESVLLQRAWVFQERLLSRRILYCTPVQ